MRDRRTEWALPALESLTALASFVALARVPGVSSAYVLVASTVLVLGVNINTATGWALPDLPARLLNALVILGLAVLAGIRSPWAAVGVPEVAHALILLLVLRTFQRKRSLDDFILLVGAGAGFALASFRVGSVLFLPLLLIGAIAGAGGAFRLTMIGEEEDGRSRGRVIAPLRAAFRRGRQVLHGSLVGARLALMLLVLAAVVYVAIPRPAGMTEDAEELPSEFRPVSSEAGEAGAPSPEATATTGFRPEVTLGDIGKIKRNMSVAILMTVYRDERPYRLRPDEAYLRGMVLTRFDGTRWSAERTGRRFVRGSAPERGGFIELEAFPPVARSQVVRIEQEVQLQDPSGTRALFAIRRPWLVDPGPQDAVRLIAGGIMELPRSPEGKYRYQVQSLVPTVAGTDPWSQSLDAWESRVHASVPSGHDRLRRLAEEVVAGAVGEEAARRLTDHLRTRCRYTLDLPDLHPEHPVEDFLFDAREGHCELFASALCLMLRARAIPARLVTGFRGFEWIPDDRPDARPGAGIHVVRFSSAHAWVEAFFPGRGWVTLDPTPGDDAALGRGDAPPAVAGAPTAESDATAAEATPDRPWGERILTYDRDDQRRLLEGAGGVLASAGEEAADLVVRAWPLLAIGGLVLLGLVVLIPGLRRRGGDSRSRPPSRAAPSGPGGDAVRRAYLAMCDRLARRGLPRSRSETPRELARRVAARLPEAAEPVGELTALHQDVCYGERAADREDGRRATETLGALKRSLRREA